MQKKISLKKPNLVEARNWIAEQQFCRKKKNWFAKKQFWKKKKKKNTKFVAIQYKKEQKNMSKAFSCLNEQQPIFDNRLGVSLGEGKGLRGSVGVVFSQIYTNRD